MEVFLLTNQRLGDLHNMRDLLLAAIHNVDPEKLAPLIYQLRGVASEIESLEKDLGDSSAPVSALDEIRARREQRLKKA